MILEDIFKQYGYVGLLSTERAKEYGLYMDFFKEGESYPCELKEIYISAMQDELFFILDSKGEDNQNMCDYWDKKISGFIAFGSSNKELLDKLKYNIIQLILYQGEAHKKELESSLIISRKIFIPYARLEENGIDINEKNKILLPFVLVEPDDYYPDEAVEKKLRTYLPIDDKLEFLNYEIKRVNRSIRSDGSITKCLTDEQFNDIKGWLSKNDNTLS